jgi:ElaB/YqjD/DUF883 family membrane-anchored ribosome-binding protein
MTELPPEATATGAEPLAEIAAELRRAREELLGDRDSAAAQELALSSSARIVADAWERADRLITQTEHDVELVWAQVHAAVDEHVNRAGQEADRIRSDAERVLAAAEQALARAEDARVAAERLRAEAERVKARAIEEGAAAELRTQAEVRREVVRALTSVQAQVIRAFAQATDWTETSAPAPGDGRTTALVGAEQLATAQPGMVWLGARPPLPPTVPVSLTTSPPPRRPLAHWLRRRRTPHGASDLV